MSTAVGHGRERRGGRRRGRGGFTVYGTPMTIVDRSTELTMLTTEVERLRQRTAAVRQRNDSDVTRLRHVTQLVDGVLHVLDLDSGHTHTSSIVSDLEVIREQVSGRQAVIRRGRLEAKNLADQLAVARETIRRSISEKMRLQRHLDKQRIDHERRVQDLRAEVRRFQDESSALDEHIEHMTKELQNLEALSAARVSDTNALAASVQNDALGHEERLRALRAETQLRRDELARLSSLTRTLLSMLGFRDASDKLEVALDHAFDLASVQHTKIAEAPSVEETTSRLVVVPKSPADVAKSTRLPQINFPQQPQLKLQLQQPDLHLPSVNSRSVSASADGGGHQHLVRYLEESATPFLPPISNQRAAVRDLTQPSPSPSPGPDGVRVSLTASDESESSGTLTADGAASKSSPKQMNMTSLKKSKSSRLRKQSKRKGSRPSLSLKKKRVSGSSILRQTNKELTTAASVSDLTLFHGTPSPGEPKIDGQSPPPPCL